MAKSKRGHTEFEQAEMLGEIVTSPFDDTKEEIKEEVSEVIDDPNEFRMAIGQAQMEGYEYVEVSEKMFKYLLRKSKSKYLTYGDPGIKVFQVGTREEIEREESLSAEQYHEHIMRKKMAEHAAK